MSLGLASGDGGGWWAVEMTCNCLERFLFGGSNTEEWGDHRKKNFFINNPVELSMCDGPIEFSLLYAFLMENHEINAACFPSIHGGCNPACKV